MLWTARYSKSNSGLSHMNPYYLFKKSRVDFCALTIKSVKDFYFIPPNHLLHVALFFFLSTHFLKTAATAPSIISLYGSISIKKEDKREEKAQKTLLSVTLIREEKFSRSPQ